MSDVAAFHVLFPVQGGMWTGYSQFTYLPAPVNNARTNTWYAITSPIIMEDLQF